MLSGKYVYKRHRLVVIPARVAAVWTEDIGDTVCEDMGGGHILKGKHDVAHRVRTLWERLEIPVCGTCGQPARLRFLISGSHKQQPRALE